MEQEEKQEGKQKKISEATQKKIDDNKFFYSRAKYVFDYAMQEWYEPLEQATLKTEFLRLSEDEIAALYAACIDDLYRKGPKPSERPQKTTEEHLKRLKKLEKRINAAIEKFEGQAFAKLSTRSPKDAVTDKVNDRLRPILEEELAKSDGTDNGATCAFVQAARRAFRVTSGAEVLELFCSSSRIREDLAKAIEFPGAFEIDLIVREWREILAAFEFRGFVHHKELTGLSQYCYLQYWPEIVAMKDEIERSIKRFYKKHVVEHLPYDNCIVDFAVLRPSESDKLRVVIIELNPFFQDTSACLFDWKDENDKKTIHEGPFEMRLVTQAVDDPLGCLSLEWRRFVENWQKEHNQQKNPKSTEGGNCTIS